jgi:putative NIF3 family GTP cyclohydrolase 1 type 2
MSFSCSALPTSGQFFSRPPIRHKFAHTGFFKDCGINVIFGGHYATESFGVKALGAAFEKKYPVKSFFIDLELPF